MRRTKAGFIRSSTLGLVIAISLALPTTQPAMADQTDTRLPTLLDTLAADGTSPKARKNLEAEIWKIWQQHESPTISVLMSDALSAMRAGKMEQALKQLDAVVDLAPDFAEGWNQRATLLYLMRNYEASAADIAKTLELEPRHFGALSGLGLIYDRLQKPKAALRAYRKALEIHPGLEQAGKRVEKLLSEVEQDI